MRVALNALHLVPHETGGSELYARRLIPALLELNEGLELTVFCSSEAAPSLEAEPWSSEAEVVKLPVRARSRFRRVASEQLMLGVAARRRRVDLLHNLFTTAPAFPGVRQVTTIHDVIYKRYPEAHAPLLTRGMSLLVPLAKRRSTRIIAVSEATKSDLVDLLGTDPRIIDVIPEGVGIAGDTPPRSEAEVRSRLGLGEEPIVLSVSAKRQHKNLLRLLEAMQPIEDAVLLIPGYRTAYEAELREHAAALGLGLRVRFNGWVDDSTLEGLYAAASCFVFPSLAEGFGLPVLEALARGVPVACSNAMSLPEVAGDAALYFDPTSTEQITNAINRVLHDKDLADDLRTRGPQRASQFSWERAARGTLETYRRALES